MSARVLLPALTALVIALLLPVHAVRAGTTTAHVLPAQNDPGSRERQYKVHVPDGLNGPAPLVMALHGCRQTHDDVLRAFGLVAAAERHRAPRARLPAAHAAAGDAVRGCRGRWYASVPPPAEPPPVGIDPA